MIMRIKELDEAANECVNKLAPYCDSLLISYHIKPKYNKLHCDNYSNTNYRGDGDSLVKLLSPLLDIVIEEYCKAHQYNSDEVLKALSNEINLILQNIPSLKANGIKYEVVANLKEE